MSDTVSDTKTKGDATVRLMSMTEAAKRYGVRVETISDIVRVNGWTWYPMPGNARAKGLNWATIRKLDRIFGYRLAA